MKRYIKSSNYITRSSRYKKYPKVLSSKFIKSESENLRPFIVRYGWDNGDAENGPDPAYGEDLVYAENERDAERRWEEDNEFDLPSNYEGCFAREVTYEELEEWRKSQELSEDELADIEYWATQDTPYELSEEHYNFLADLAYLTKEFTEKDFRDLKEDMSISYQLDNYMNQSMIAQEQENDKKLQRLGRVVAKFLKKNK